MRLYGVIIILLSAILCWVSCERDLSTTLDEYQSEKDGIIDFLIETTDYDSIDHKVNFYYDTLSVSEKENMIEVINYIPFEYEVNTKGVFFSCEGSFSGLNDHVFVYHERFFNFNNTVHRKQKYSAIKKNTTRAIILSENSLPMFKIKGAIFFLDENEIHDGDALFLISFPDSQVDTLMLSANKHTVNYNQKSKSHTIKNISSETFGIRCFDYLSFESDFGACWLLKNKKNSNIIEYGSSFRGSGLDVESLPDSMELTSFALDFVNY